MTVYVTVETALAIHDDQIARYGGSSGVRDLGLLESALARPQSGYYADLIEQASALWESLAQNHPFVDGNKRAAFAVAYTFLLSNGLLISADEQEAYAFIMARYATGTFRFDALAAWLRQNTRAA